MPDDLTPEAEAAHWEVSCRLAVTLTVIALVLLVGIAFAAPVLDAVSVLGLPLGYVMAGVGVPVLMLLLLFGYEGRQGGIDERHGAAED